MLSNRGIYLDEITVRFNGVIQDIKLCHTSKRANVIDFMYNPILGTYKVEGWNDYIKGNDDTRIYYYIILKNPKN